MAYTEIMCTLSGEQLADPALVKALTDAGMTAVRINTAHLHGAEELADIASRLKAQWPNVKILIDTKGPEMRTTALPDDREVMLRDGDMVAVEGSDTDRPSSAQCIVVNFPGICGEVEPGDILLIDDGRIELKVENVVDTGINARVTRGGMLGSRKGISIAGKEPDLPGVGTHDLEYIRLAAASADIDLIAHSFVRRADDVSAVKEAMSPGHKPVIAKIENRQGIENLDEITAVADGILIARGDLTATLGPEAVPEAQELIAAATVGKGLPLVLATKILPSMMESPRATDADLQGIDVALGQGVGTMLLTNETATGHFPVECVRTLSDAIRNYQNPDR